VFDCANIVVVLAISNTNSINFFTLLLFNNKSKQAGSYSL
jgi:hypothetical protein